MTKLVENTYAIGTNMDDALTQEKTESIVTKRYLKKTNIYITYHKQGAEATLQIELMQLRRLREEERYGTVENFMKKEHA